MTSVRLTLSLKTGTDRPSAAKTAATALSNQRAATKEMVSPVLNLPACHLFGAAYLEESVSRVLVLAELVPRVGPVLQPPKLTDGGPGGHGGRRGGRGGNRPRTRSRERVKRGSEAAIDLLKIEGG